ncbi:MAG TPA: hypothetical protein VE961_07860 [Pyrinomonadaceae bacterium]|nr:hypothetical protein [Pyrinomonadaceae bacterium]
MSETREITVETERLLVIRRRYRAVEEWCEECDRLALMIRPDQAAAVTGRTLRMIFTEIESGQLHFREYPDGSVLLCLNTLLTAS